MFTLEEYKARIGSVDYRLPLKKSKILLMGLAIIISYKFISILYTGKNDDYFDTQFGLALLKIPLIVIAIYYSKKNNLFNKLSNPILSKDWIYITLFLFGFYLVKKSFLEHEFIYLNFFRETFFNFFAAIFEEIVFKSLIFYNILQFMKRKHAFISTSALFSIWHFNLISHWTEYVNIFVFSIFTIFLFEKNYGIFLAIFFHFIWNQIHYAIGFELIGTNQAYIYTFFLLNIVFFCALILPLYKENNHYQISEYPDK